MRRFDRPRVPKPARPAAVILAYEQQLLEVVTEASSAVAGVIEWVMAGWPEPARADAKVTAKWVRSAVRGAADRVSKRMPEKKLARAAREVAEKTKRHQRAQTKRQLAGKVSVDVLGVEPELGPVVRAFVAENVALIRSIPKRYFQEVEGLVIQALERGTRATTIANQFVARLGVAKNRARLIAVDQVGKLYGRLTTERHKAMGIARYLWRTSGDNRVRVEHEERDGEEFGYDDPPEDGHPGEPPLCRCWQEPVIDDLFEEISDATGLEGRGHRHPPRRGFGGPLRAAAGEPLRRHVLPAGRAPRTG